MNQCQHVPAPHCLDAQRVGIAGVVVIDEPGRRTEAGTLPRLPLCLVLALLLTAPALAQSARYLAGIEDVPLMDGLTAAPAESVAFDSPPGRIVIVRAEGPVERAKVVDFYARSLDALGWDRVGDAAFRREGEILRLEFTRHGGLLDVCFTLSPVH